MDRSQLAIRLAPFVIGLISVMFLAMKGCEEGPFGRKRVVNISYEEEFQLGKQSYQQILSKSAVVSPNEEIVKVVRRVGERLAKAASRPDIRKKLNISDKLRLEWEFNVVADKTVNAFCLPGGKVVVNTGILPVCETEEGLAVVMGHEIGHALARHGVERMSTEQLKNIGITSAAAAIGGGDPMQTRQIAGLLSAGANLGLSLPFSRSNESEADRIGAILMAAAGYDPREASKFWVRMSKATGGSQGPSFMSTHPSHEDRQRNLENWAETEAREYYKTAEKAKDATRKLPIVNLNSLHLIKPGITTGSWNRDRSGEGDFRRGR
ncbi:MAG: M48 family metallopeptidase [Gemmataceae bacterium]|jgi:predicted Zn-dependent protease|nr:M48 family metallopeptidase [Gemmataceae bacterium]